MSAASALVDLSDHSKHFATMERLGPILRDSDTRLSWRSVIITMTPCRPPCAGPATVPSLRLLAAFNTGCPPTSWLSVSEFSRTYSQTERTSGVRRERRRFRSLVSATQGRPERESRTDHFS